MEFKKPARRQSQPPHTPRPTTGTGQKNTPVHPLQSQQKTASAVRFHTPTKRQAAAGGVLLIVLAGIIGWIVISPHHSAAPRTQAPQQASKMTVVSPNGKDIKNDGKWLTPPKSPPLFVYTDMLDGVRINVSQQQLPESFQHNTQEHIADVAKKFNATTKLVAGDTTAFLGTSSEGPQSVLLAKQGLLILIKSEKKITDTSWVRYITSLKTV